MKQIFQALINENLPNIHNGINEESHIDSIKNSYMKKICY